MWENSNKNNKVPKIFRRPESLNSDFIKFGLTDAILEPIEIVDGIRITPSFIRFANAYEGKIFKEKLVIQNVGKNVSIVRMLPPTSNTFQVKYFKQGHRLSPGLKIVRTITYRHMSSIAVPQAILPIWINDKLVEIKIIVTLSTAVISVDPQIVDFGRIDVNQAATVRTLTIYNTGYKGTQFAIDLGSNQLQLVVEPMKGTVYAQSSVCLILELVGSNSGDFLEEFWIKTEPPHRVVVQGTFIQPKLLTRSFFDSLHFSIVEFPKTYYGARTIKPLFIKNYSSSNSTFYILAEIRGRIMTLEEARKIDDNYNQFSLLPYDGRMYAEKGSLVLITFTPKRVKNIKHEKNHFACFLRIIRMNWKDVTPGIFKEEVQFVSDEASITESVMELEANPAESSAYQLNYEASAQQFDSFDMESSLKVAIYGDKETPKINVRPDLFVLNDLEIGGNYTRELFIENQSKYNPIIIKYCKIVNIDVVPEKFKLNPRHNVEIIVKIHPVQMGRFSKTIVLDLLYPDTPDITGELRKIDQISVRIEYDVKMGRKITKKPCQINKDLTEYLQEPLKDYRLTVKEEELRTTNRAYYANYFKEIFNKKPSEKNDYDLTDKRLLLMEHFKYKPIPVVKFDNKLGADYFIPLSPKQLYSIRICPTFINLKKLAPYTTITERFSVENENDFPVRMRLRTSKPCINFQWKARSIIGANQTKHVDFNFFTTNIGNYNATIDVVINESHVLEITTVANVVPKDVRLVDRKVEFLENDDNYKLIKIYNDLNSAVTFKWDLQDSCFDVFPKSGRICSESYINCAIYYTPNPVFSERSEFSVFSESQFKQTVQLSYKKSQPHVVLVDQKLDCGLIPINTTIWKYVTLLNQKQQILYYRIENPHPIDGIDIEPTDGVMKFKDELKLKIKLHFNSPLQFTAQITIHLQELQDVIVEISGIVDCPEITVKPDYIQLANIPPQSYGSYSFKIQNLSQYSNRIRFLLNDYPGITITETEENPDLVVKELELKTNEIRTLYCHFHPDEVCNYLLYLPIIINDLIGPPIINNYETTKFRYYNTDFDGKKLLPLLKICCSTSREILKISSLQIQFVYYGPNHRNNRTIEFIEITNICEDSMEISLQLDDLNCFEMVAINLKSFKFYLDTQQTAIFQIVFKPQQIGNYRCKVPIFYNQQFFNCLTLNGLSKLPDLIPEKSVLYFEPIVLNLKIQDELVVYVDDNHTNCEIFAESDLDEITTTYRNGPLITCEDREKILIITITSPKMLCIDNDLEIFCSCGSRNSVRIKGVIINSLITAHNCYEQIAPINCEQIDLIYKNSDDFPRFPKRNQHYRQVVEIVENWLFVYCFERRKYYHIPKSFTDFKLIDNSDKKRFPLKKIVRDPPLIDLILLRTGRQQRRFLVKDRLKSTKEIDQLEYIFTIYTDTLDFLKQSGCLLPHVEAKLLLNYQQYLLYHKTKENRDRYFYGEFRLLSKQCWLDVLLEIVRVFVYEQKIRDNPQICESNKYSDRTIRIMEWLKERCLDENPNLGSICCNFKRITDLRDCVILSYVTMSYCPYIRDAFGSLIQNPNTDEDIFHNCCILIDTWRLLKFNIYQDPLCLFHPKLIEMLLLLNHLYEILPNYLPREPLIINAPLSQCGSIKLPITNPYRSPIIYSITLINNNRQLFMIEEKSIKVGVRKTVQLTIQYFAKFIKSSSAILILSNDKCKSLVYNLVGKPDLSHYSAEIKLNLELYDNRELDLCLQSPYKQSCTYRAKFTYRPGDRLHDFTTNASIIFQQNSTDFDGNGQCLTKTKIRYLELDKRPLWVYYLNQSIGDWCIKFVINVEHSPNTFRVIKVFLPKNFDNFQCSCQYGPDLNHLNCPKIIKIPIPSRNYFLWEIRKDLILETISSEDYELWKYRLGTPSGARIIELMVQSSLKFVENSQQYRINFDRNPPPFILNDSLEILDVFSEQTVNLIVHAIEHLTGLNLFMSLLSLDGKEIRYYQLKFVVSSI